MSAIMQGKTGNREKAIIMFLSLAQSLDASKNGLCNKLSIDLQNILIPAFANGAKLSKEFLISVEKARKNAQESL